MLTSSNPTAPIDVENEDVRRKCAAEITTLLNNYKCVLVGIPTFQSDGRGGFFVVVKMSIEAGA